VTVAAKLEQFTACETGDQHLAAHCAGAVTMMHQPYARRLIVVVQSPLLLQVVGQNIEATFPKDPTIRSPSIV